MDQRVSSHPHRVDSPLRRTIHALASNRMAMAGLALVVCWAVIAVAAPVIAPYGPLAQDVADRMRAPSLQHLFGTDELGRDVFSRVVYGARISLPIGIAVVVFALVLGSLLGALAGFIGGAADQVIMRAADVTLAFPSIVLALAIASALGPSVLNALIAMVAVWWPEYARLMRAQVHSVKNNEFVLAARAIGVPGRRILFRHIIPNAMVPCIVKASMDVGNAVLTIAALSFIGLGAVPPAPEWGAMISSGRFKFYMWWLTTFPGLAILSSVLAFNFLGDGIRDAFDPRIRGA